MTPISGTLSLSQVRAELGLAGAFSMSNANARKLSGVLSGVMSLSQFRACQWIGVNKYPTSNIYYMPDNIASRIVLAPGLTVFGNSYALFITAGQNSNVTFDNYGTLQGPGGAANGGAGGTALYTDTYVGGAPGGTNGNLTINNFGSILAGGGGGGHGGVGGQGGNGYYVATAQDGGPYYSSPGTWAGWEWDGGGNIHRTRMMYFGTQVYDGYYVQANGIYNGGYTYYFGAYQYTGQTWPDWQGTPAPPPSGSCFPAGARVLMGDLTERQIETLVEGDVVMTVTGPAPLDFMGHPILGHRRMLGFRDGHRWSEEHSHWSRASDDGSQWLWTANKSVWIGEVELGVLGGLLDNESIRTGGGYELAHVDGWKKETPQVLGGYAPDTPLFFPNVAGSLMIVDGYVVSAGFDQRRFNPVGFDWDKARGVILGKE